MRECSDFLFSWPVVRTIGNNPAEYISKPRATAINHPTRKVNLMSHAPYTTVRASLITILSGILLFSTTVSAQVIAPPALVNANLGKPSNANSSSNSPDISFTQVKDDRPDIQVEIVNSEYGPEVRVFVHGYCRADSNEGKRFIDGKPFTVKLQCLGALNGKSIQPGSPFQKTLAVEFEHSVPLPVKSGYDVTLYFGKPTTSKTSVDRNVKVQVVDGHLFISILTPNWPKGDYVLTAIADSANQITESNEKNNQTQFKFSVKK